MTLGAMWVREAGDHQELVCVSDSRLSGGGARWDACQKVVPLARGDCIASFSGDTQYAYPLLLQVLAALDASEEARGRRVPLEKMRGHVWRVLNGSLGGLDLSGQAGAGIDDRSVLMFGGYSWWSERWLFWEVRWSSAAQRFTRYTRRQPKAKGVVRWTGDRPAIDEGKRRLNRLLADRSIVPSQLGLDMEPLEVIRDIVRDAAFESVGGPLQVAKTWKHLDSRPFVVRWRSTPGGEPIDTLYGRPLLEYEKVDRYGTIDVDCPNLYSEWFADTPEADIDDQ